MLPLRPALRFLAAHLRPSVGLIGFMLAYTTLASWGIPTLQARGVLGRFVTTLAVALISATGQAITFIAASLVLQEHLTSKQ
ncbi:MAG: hypothetical protein HY600_02280 [Candidatus Omnitrophica bacterium]|nr:hypothetical protein [Candidatus Omnitrophota bacterium]